MESNQYIGVDGLWHVTITVSLPKLLVKNKLNFRIHHLELKDGENVRDPNLESSNYIFEIDKSLLGKKVFFNAYFPCKEIANVKDFVFGLCDEGVRWHNLNEFSVIINNQYAPIKVEDFRDIEIIEEVEVKIIINNELEEKEPKISQEVEVNTHGNDVEDLNIFVQEESIILNKKEENMGFKENNYEKKAPISRKSSSKKFEKKKR